MSNAFFEMDFLRFLRKARKARPTLKDAQFWKVHFSVSKEIEENYLDEKWTWQNYTSFGISLAFLAFLKDLKKGRFKVAPFHCFDEVSAKIQAELYL